MCLTGISTISMVPIFKAWISWQAAFHALHFRSQASSSALTMSATYFPGHWNLSRSASQLQLCWRTSAALLLRDSQIIVSRFSIGFTTSWVMKPTGRY